MRAALSARALAPTRANGAGNAIKVWAAGRGQALLGGYCQEPFPRQPGLRALPPCGGGRNRAATTARTSLGLSNTGTTFLLSVRARSPSKASDGRADALQAVRMTARCTVEVVYEFEAGLVRGVPLLGPLGSSCRNCPSTGEAVKATAGRQYQKRHTWCSFFPWRSVMCSRLAAVFCTGALGYLRSRAQETPIGRSSNFHASSRPENPGGELVSS